MRKLASVQKIVEINPIPDADAIERATVLGWNVVVKKGEFTPGDVVVYFEVDSLLPVKPEFEFLRKSSFNPRLDGFRIRTVKLRGQISQGLVYSMDILPKGGNPIPGDDVTDLLEVRKYEPEIPACLGGEVKGSFPPFIPKTDEIRIQSVPDVLTRHDSHPCVITEKIDGTSSTFYFNEGEFGVCGRNWEFKDATENTYTSVAKSLNLREKLEKHSHNIAIQGEIVGPGIQGNKYKLTEHKLFVYHVFNIDKQEYLYHVEMENICSVLGLETVPILERNFFLNEKIPTVEKAVEFSIGQSALNKDTKREGVVVKTALFERDFELGRLSFKIINPKFLLKYEQRED